jgi:tetratricopeptide (TPR) repeat protein
MLEDRFGLPLSTESASAVEAYVTGLDLMLSANVGAAEALDEAIRLDPDFALAHTARARQKLLAADMAAAKKSADRARALASGLDRREAGHIDVIGLVVAGQNTEAYTRLEAHLSDYPRDALPLSTTVGAYGLLGFSGRADHHEAQRALLERLAPHWGDDWWFDTYRGWSLIETDDPVAGRKIVGRALEANPGNGHGAHAYSHGFYEAGDVRGGIAFLTEWLPTYDRRAQLFGHLSWHHAMLELQRGDPDAAAEIYDRGIRPAVSHNSAMFILVDCAAYLWRRAVAGHPPPADDAREIRDFALAHFPHAGMHFVNLHRALALAAANDETALAEHIEEVHALVAEGRQPPGAVMETVCAGFAAFARGDHDSAAAALAEAQREMERIGGSHAQRDVITDTLIAAHLRAGRREDAAREMRARHDRRAKHLDAAWLERMAG